MSTIGVNPLINQGNLNRVLTHIIVPTFPTLNVTAPFMTKELATLTFDQDFVDQIGTATGVVNSPQPYTMGEVVFNLIRTQPLAGLWLAQTQISCILGQVTVYSDASNFPALALNDCSIMKPEPGPYDGTNPTVKFTVKGSFPINSFMFA